VVHGDWAIDLGILHTTATDQLPAFIAQRRDAVDTLAVEELLDRGLVDHEIQGPTVGAAECGSDGPARRHAIRSSTSPPPRTRRNPLENDIAIMAVRSTSTERLTDYGLSPTRLSHEGYNRIVVESEYCQ